MTPRWQIAIDTGGTFTDVMATDPQGRLHRAKVLSNASAIARVIDAAPRQWRLDRSFPDGLFDDCDLRSGDTTVRVATQRGAVVHLSDVWPGPPPTRVQLQSALPIPAFAAHWVTQTPAQQRLPTMQLRLATTRATNALLERRGARSAMLLTEGLEDVLRIGTQQRPDLFARVVRKSPPFASSCLPLTERLAADGSVLEPLDRTQAVTQLEHLRREGVESIGIALLHAFRNPQHEEQVATWARDVGFEHVCTSSALSARQGYLERARTCDVNAYLAPVMASYLGDLQERLGAGSELLLMNSAGELLHSNLFEPKDGLLSGPAGGVQGAAHAARRATLDRALAFDMGGTSTDVTRIAGEPERTHRQQVGDALLWAPSVDTETVAAGGGSICHVENGLPQVGPQSAGAAPGPACYGNGGPLTLTDVNVLLGRMRAERFPFALDVEASRHALQAIRVELALQHTDEAAVLEGFLRVANERMAEALRRVSLQRGHDPRRHHLVAFGGAGGQHACAIADLLDLPGVVVPADASLLSAVGVAASVRAVSVESQVLQALQHCGEDIAQRLQDLSHRAHAGLDRQGAGARRQEHREAELRYVGQDSVVRIAFSQPHIDALQARFEERYAQLHQTRPEDRDIELVTLRVRVQEEPQELEPTDARFPDAPADPHANVKANAAASREASAEDARTQVFHEGRWHSTPVRARESLRVGEEVSGPLLVEEEHSVFYLPPGWRVQVHESGALLAQPLQEGGANVMPQGQSDVVERTLFMHRFEAIAREMGTRLQQAAISTNVKEREDFSCAVLDAEGRLVVNAPHIPVHLGALGSCVRGVRQHRSLADGDFVVTNHPAFGGSHLPDVTVLAPVFDAEGILFAHVACRAHHAEIGGIAPGSMPAQATRLHEEGVVLPPMLLASAAGSHLEDLRAALLQAPYPTRSVQDNLADAQAMLVACRRGVAALQSLAAQVGARCIGEHMDALHSLAAARSGQALQALRDGERVAATKLDDGSALRVRITLQQGRATVDFSGSADTHPGNLNATASVVTSCVLYVMRLLARGELPFNEGLLDPVRLVLPEGLLSPRFEADATACPAIVGGNVETSQRLVDLLLTAFEWSACSQGTMNNLSFGNDGFGYYETLGGGCGAGVDFDGESAVQCHMTNTRITDTEVLEHRHPVRVQRFQVRERSGGQGQHRGGDGLVRHLQFTEDVQVSVLTQHRVFGPAGAEGGGAGAAGLQVVLRADGTREDLGSIDRAALRAGDGIVVQTPGGGGWGKV